MKVVLTESQLRTVILTESLFNIKDKEKFAKYVIALLYGGAITLNAALGLINKAPNLSQKDKVSLKSEITMSFNNQAKTVDGAKTDTTSFAQEPKQQEWKLADTETIVTVYNAVPSQCNADCGTTASGFKLNFNNIGAHRVCAVERTFMKALGLHYGDVIKIEGTYNGAQDGIYQVQDTMNKRFAGKHKVDILVPTNVKYGGTLKDQKAKLYVLTDKSKTDEYIKNMLPSNKRKKG